MNKRWVVLLLVCVAGLAALTPGVAGQETARSADLVVDQPSYASGDIQQTLVNGTTRYEVGASPVELRPLNFDADAVVNFGATTAGGQLRYDEDMREFVFSANASGTYRLFWVVEETRTVNGTSGTNTTTVPVRYQAQVRVDGVADVQAVSGSRLAQLENRAAQWREFNRTVQDLRERDFLTRPDERTTDETIQGMISAYVATGDPIGALSGNATTILLLMVSSLGGGVIFLGFFGFNAIREASARKIINQYREAEAEEGALADREARQAINERLRTAAGHDLQDLDNIDDYWGRQLRDAHGPNLRTAAESISQQYLRNTPIDYLTVMDQNGYAVVEDDDGLAVVHETEADEAAVVAPDELGEQSTAALLNIDWGEPPVSTFDIGSADIEWADLPEDTGTLDLESWADGQSVGLDHAADISAYGERVVELLAAVEDHEITDSDGSLNGRRAYLEATLDTTYAAEQHKLPIPPLLRELLEAAVRHHSPRDRVEQTVEDITTGRYEPGDD